jgi:chromosome segregation ATPase
MNYELLYKLAIEENDKLKSEASVLRKRNERLYLEIEKFETLIKSIEEEKITLKNQMDLFKDEINLLKSALEFKEEEKQSYSHYS